ncbi:MAG: hypothetical protein RRA92_09515 [Gemmatimonadota bacterium]|nr:hypothetical protein [Gemmatimonadota bacterium]
MSAQTSTVTPDRALSTVHGRISGIAFGFWLAAIAVGAAGFALGVGAAPQRAWQAVYVNFLFWTSLAQAGVIFGAVLVTAKGHWGKPFRRVAEPMGAFLPLALLVFAGMYFGGPHIFPWLDPAWPGHINRVWLTLDGVFLRNGLLLFVLFAASFVFLRLSLRPDAPLLADRQTGWRKAVLTALARGWRGDEEEAARSRRILGWLGPLLIGIWVLVFSLLAFDFTMSLMPSFLSVIWGAMYFMGGWLCMLCLVAVLAHRYKEHYRLEDVWGKWEFHDLGKLMFAFVIFWSYIWFSQFLPIWYGNIGRETQFFTLRTENGFGPLLWAQMALIFFIPFALLLWRRPKMNSRHLALVGLVVLAGFWLERYLQVVPSIWKGGPPPFGLTEVAVTLGFLGLFGLSYSLYASLTARIPIREALVLGERSKGP